VKSIASIDPDTSTARRISMPLASISVVLFPCCGLARARIKRENMTRRRRKRRVPGRVFLSFGRDAAREN
jgi:hypothetical protein